ncbi:YfiR family protein [Brevundimonas sp.]|uniref:YfiR family protein n=1 Tax=Brevundimonas sp. TaxID=1871086 RepID=UPI0025CB8181|nr:YfiR family protein [Brevundimonas sp.]
MAGAIAAWLALGAPAAVAQSLEQPVKANYLARFAAFVQWPARAEGSGPIRVCVVGADPFGAVLDQALASQTVNGRRLEARRIARISAGSGCHIAYLGGSSSQTVGEGLAAVAGEPVLTVTDEARGSARGVIHFTIFQNRVRFHIDDVQAGRGGLSISSRLLNLALSVRSRS